MQQSNAAAATSLYENPGPGVSGGDAGDAVKARWLQSAGLQHLASPMSSNAVDHRLLPNLLMQVLLFLFIAMMLSTLVCFFIFFNWTDCIFATIILALISRKCENFELEI